MRRLSRCGRRRHAAHVRRPLRPSGAPGSRRRRDAARDDARHDARSCRASASRPDEQPHREPDRPSGSGSAPRATPGRGPARRPAARSRPARRAATPSTNIEAEQRRDASRRGSASTCADADRQRVVGPASARSSAWWPLIAKNDEQRRGCRRAREDVVAHAGLRIDDGGVREPDLEAGQVARQLGAGDSTRTTSASASPMSRLARTITISEPRRTDRVRARHDRRHDSPSMTRQADLAPASGAYSPAERRRRQR